MPEKEDWNFRYVKGTYTPPRELLSVALDAVPLSLLLYRKLNFGRRDSPKLSESLKYRYRHGTALADKY